MFTYQERIKAVQLLIQYDMSYATVIREQGRLSTGTKNTSKMVIFIRIS